MPKGPGDGRKHTCHGNRPHLLLTWLLPPLLLQPSAILLASTKALPSVSHQAGAEVRGEWATVTALGEPMVKTVIRPPLSRSDATSPAKGPPGGCKADFLGEMALGLLLKIGKDFNKQKLDESGGDVVKQAQVRKLQGVWCGWNEGHLCV